MEVLFHFIFELVKISILSSIYATVILFIFNIIGHFKPESWFNKVSAYKKIIWFSCGFIISIGLFLYMFSYWGDHGLGDSARIPIGHFKAVKYGGNAYIEKLHHNQLGIRNFAFDKKYLYAETIEGFTIDKEEYVVWDLQTGEWKFFKTKEDYLQAAREYNYPTPDNFEEFWEQYKKHWHGWRGRLFP